jgi:hypothetical protein
MVQPVNFALNNKTMRNIPGTSRRAELRRFVLECENEVKVSEVEKVLSQLAYLMSLYITDCEPVREKLRTTIGVLSKSFSELSMETKDQLKSIAVEMSMPTSPRIIFWMWRAWILQLDSSLEGKSTSLAIRNANEWLHLPNHIQVERERMNATCQRLVEDFNILSEIIVDSNYILQSDCGSPYSILIAAKKLLKEATENITKLENLIADAYGFGTQHRPNMKFDKQAARNIRAYYHWKHHPDDHVMYQEFSQRANGMRNTPQQSKNAAIKAASRFEAKISDYDAILKKAEKYEQIPSIFYARRIEVASE